MKVINALGFMVLAAPGPTNATPASDKSSLLNRLGVAVVAGDEAAARSLLSGDAKVISYFNKELRLDSLEGS